MDVNRVPDRPLSTTEQEERLTMLLRRCGKFMYYHSKPGMQQGMVLQLLRDGPLTQRQIQERLGTQPGSVSELISKLESKHLLDRQRNEADRRQVLLTLTDKGREVSQRHTAYPTRGLYSALSAQEQDTLATLLEQLLDAWTEKRM